MNPLTVQTLLLVALTAAILGAALGYLARYPVNRPAIGLINDTDVLVILAAVVAMPLTYLALPGWAAVALLTPTGAAIVFVTLQPVLRRPAVVGLGTAIVTVPMVVLAATAGTESTRFLAANNVAIGVMVIGIANLWAQCGMKVRHVARLAAALTVYDVVATTLLPFMAGVQDKIGHVPFAPFLAWSIDGVDLGVGLGDLLLAATFVLTVRMQYGRRAAGAAFALMAAGIAGALALLTSGLIGPILPVMVILGPLMLVHYVLLRRGGRGLSVREYRQARDLPWIPLSTLSPVTASEPGRR